MRDKDDRPLAGEEREFFRRLYQDHYKALFSYASRMGIGREAAEDFVHEAFMTAIRHIEDIRQCKNPGKYLNQALKNVIGYQLRSLRYALELQRKVREGLELRQEEAYRDELRPETLYRGIVSDEELELLIRFHLEGWSQKELAEEAGVSENAVKQRIKRAKQHLRSALEDTEKLRAPGSESKEGRTPEWT